MKKLPITLFALVIFMQLQAQPIINDGSLTTIMLNTDNSTRHNNFFYPNYKLAGLTIISIHQPESTYDLIFWVDEHGNTQYKSKADTGPYNKSFNYIHRYDSFNPYGSTDIREALFAGVMNTLFKNHIRGWRFK